MTALEFATIATATLGAALGLINTFWALQRDRVRIRVAPVWMQSGRPTADGRLLAVTTELAELAVGDGRLGVRVTNLGLTEVTIEGVGVTPDGLLKRLFGRRFKSYAIALDGIGAVRLPHRLPPRDSIVIWSAPISDASLPRISDGRRVYATTACGLRLYGTSRLLRHITKRLRERD